MLSLFFGLTLVFVTTGVATAEPSRENITHTSDQNYTLAYKKSVEQDKPLMVVIGAPYCPACQVLKQTTIANMSRSGELDNVSLAVVDRDAEPELAKQLMADEKMIPQIIVYSKSSDGHWKRRRLMGYQPVQPVRTLLQKVRDLGRG
ncbi:thioredoxin-like negative regulator of GroEL [Rhodopirellula rubra]|uniref:Thioredoxin-like negative regulator of GroEL n=1 Tax=Aporhodopirellula rubra TaxID=980271 RepID=A0A7W5H7Q8_9BACT|nr:thioredoxin family protein [Aporhodopirellula rubra]MBB3208206.1 thioredoxin-like negative regulator of GroEL [Aporhodopirellula rubra]